MQSVGTALDLLARAGAVNTATKVEVLHPEWDDTAVKGRGPTHPFRDRYSSSGPCWKFPTLALRIFPRRNLRSITPLTQFIAGPIGHFQSDLLLYSE